MGARPELDYVEATSRFIFWLPREIAKDGDLTPNILMREYGFDLSLSASSSHTACLYTDEPYAAAALGQYATPAARVKLETVMAALEDSRRKASSRPVLCPAGHDLWPYQKVDIDYALARRNTLIADEPGLGKTPTAIVFANEIEAKRVLVICPASIRLQWAKRIREWSVMPWPYIVHTVLNGRRGINPAAAWTVISYDLARAPAINKALQAQHYDLLILDEAHYLKSLDARRTKAVLGAAGVIQHADRVLALTGTPLPNRPRECFTLAKALCPDAIDWMGEDAFNERFNPSATFQKFNHDTGKTSVWSEERTGRHMELQNRLRANFMCRHLKRDVLTQLKLPVYDLIEVEETRAVKAALHAESLLNINPESLEGADAVALGHVATVRKEMGLAIAPQVAAYVETLLDGGEEKLLLFAWHIEVLDILEKALARHGVVRIDGRTSATKKDNLIQRFIDDPGIKVALGNLLSLGTGTDGLQTVCCHALIAEPSWTPGENVQAFDRLDRGGQQRTVQGEIFVAPGSFAEKILASALRKMRTTNKVLDRIYA